MLCLVMMPLQAQDVTPAPEKPDFAFSFPLEAPTDAQIQEAFNCALSRESPEATLTPSQQHKPTGCELARQVVACWQHHGHRIPTQPTMKWHCSKR